VVSEFTVTINQIHTIRVKNSSKKWNNLVIQKLNPVTDNRWNIRLLNLLLFAILLMSLSISLVQADTSYYDPVSDVTTGWDDGSGTTYDEINDGIRQPIPPDLLTNLQSRVNDGLISEYNFNSVSESNINNFTLWVYVNNGDNAEFTYYLQQSGAIRCSLLVGTSVSGWQSCTWSSVSGDLSSVTIELGQCNKNGGGAPSNCRVDSGYLEVDYNVSVDSENPGINILIPSNNSLSSDNGLDVNYTTSDDVSVDECWYSKNSENNISLSDCTTNITSEIWNEGLNNVSIYVNDTSNNINESFVFFTIDTIGPNFINLQNQTINESTSLILVMVTE
jgi:hypothetical protein